MKTYLDCYPCFMEQALRTSRVATNDKKKIKKILDEVGTMIKNMPIENTPAESGMLVYNKIKEITGVADPYLNIKQQHIKEAKELLPEMEVIIKNAEDPLLSAIRIAIAGNVIDLGINKPFNLLADIKKILNQKFAIFDYESLKKDLAAAKNILYIGDNAGESVFDTLLIKQLKKPVIYAVRSKPIINDVTIKDAIDSGLDSVSEIIDSGCNSPGVVLSQATNKFLNVFNNADLIISKGQGNYEGLSDENKTIYFLLKAKCSVIANDLNVKEGDIILKKA